MSRKLLLVLFAIMLTLLIKYDKSMNKFDRIRIFPFK